MEKLDNLAMRKLLERLTGFHYTTVKLLNKLIIRLRRESRVVRKLLIDRAHCNLPRLTLLFTLYMQRLTPSFTITSLTHDIKLFNRIGVRTVIAVQKRPTRIRRLVARLAVVGSENRKRRFMLSDFTTGFILKLVEQSVPTDAKTLKRNRYSKLIAALGEFKLLRPLIKRLKVRISNFNFESTLNIVSLCNNLYRARLLILALLKDITANGVFNLKREWSFLERRAENLN